MAESLELVVQQVMQLFLWFYIATVVGHLVIQVILAQVHHRRSADRRIQLDLRDVDRTVWPSVAVLVPVYNEAPEDLRRCLDSIANQDYQGGIAVEIVDDASPNRAEVMRVYDEFGAIQNWSVHLETINRGKRHAQDVGYKACSAELIVTVDSDTQLASDAIRRGVSVFRDRRVGAITGDVRVSNWRSSLLSCLIDLRYWSAFHQERASQSLMGAVLCCSGPFAIYRTQVLDHVWQRYIGQRFRGQLCTYGDDRHLTNLVLSEGHKTRFVEDARCITAAPTNLRTYLKQQLRWNKSYYRELLWTLTFLPRLGLVMSIEVVVQTLLPFMLVVALLATALRSIEEGPSVWVRYLLTVAVMGLIHTTYGVLRTRDPRFLLFVLYGLLHAIFLIPVRIRASSTLSDTSWGTRAVPGTSSPKQTSDQRETQEPLGLPKQLELVAAATRL